jgi:hypothetical protein
MSAARPFGIWQSRYLPGCLLLLAFAGTAGADPKPLSKEEQAKVDKAIEKGVAYLKHIQREKGDWTAYMIGPHIYLGQMLLPAYALLEAGVPANDPAIQKATNYLHPILARHARADNAKADWDDFEDTVKEAKRKKLVKHLPSHSYDTYQFSLAILFLDKLGDPKDKKLIQTLALRLIAGQHRTGGWSYSCPIVKEEDEERFLNLLTELDKNLEAGEKLTAKLLKTLDVPRSLQPLTVFQDRKKFTWRESYGSADKTGGKAPDRLDIGVTDNSNTQFALLALWVAQRHGIPMRPTFDLLVERFERTQRIDGGWPYAWKYQDRPSSSMICVGLLGLAVGRGLKLEPLKTSSHEARDAQVLKGLTALYGEIGVPSGQMDKPVPYSADVYFLWSLERVGMLYDLPSLGDKEWYRWGAEILVTNQKSDGHWDQARIDMRKVGQGAAGYHPPITTAFALLFLKRSHPMKDLTSKLPFTAQELNQRIARILQNPRILDKIAPTSSRNTELDR